MKALVTGGGGFIGRYIVEQLLARGDAPAVLARNRYPELEALGAETVRADLADAAAVAGACRGRDVVFHVAARPGIWGRWKAFYAPNVTGTENVIAGCRRHGVSRLVFTSSPSVVFDNRPHRGADESLPYPAAFENHYSQTKAMAERLVREASDGQLMTVSLRPHLVFGPRDPHLLPRVIARARAGQLMQVGDGDNRVDLSYVEDVARAHLLAADALVPGARAVGSVYFLSQGAPVKLWEWIGNLLRRLEIPPVERRIPLATARRIGALLEALYRVLPLQGEPRMSRFLASELALDHYYDIGRAKRELGFEPRFGMDEALERTVAWLRLG